MYVAFNCTYFDTKDITNYNIYKYSSLNFFFFRHNVFIFIEKGQDPNINKLQSGPKRTGPTKTKKKNLQSQQPGP